LTLACLLVAVWLLCGAGLRHRFAVFDRIYIPPSVIAGFIGLLVMQTLGRSGSGVAASHANAADNTTWQDFFSVIASSLATANAELRSWPAILISIVFAGMLLPRGTVPWKQSIRSAGREALMVWIIVLGQTAIGLLATWLIIQPLYDLPASFGMLLETGFAGGHGTAGAMGQVFSAPQVGLPAGLDLGLLMATVGLVYGTVSGIVWINLALRWGWVSQNKSMARSGEQVFLDEEQTQREVGRSAFSRGLDPMLVQAIWLALAFTAGMAIQSLVGIGSRIADGPVVQADALDPSADRISADQNTAAKLVDDKVSFAGVSGSFPLFVYTLIGGWVVRKLLKLIGGGHLIDEVSIARWGSMAMDLMVVAAIATLNIAAVIELVVPFMVLVVCGMVWTSVCLMVISRRVLPSSHWFELGLINYGMSTGTTATGFVLLRIIDPELKTDAAKEYAMAAPFSAPFIGGGMLTIALPLLVLERVPIVISAVVITLIVSALTVVACRLPRRDETKQ